MKKILLLFCLVLLCGACQNGSNSLAEKDDNIVHTRYRSPHDRDLIINMKDLNSLSFYEKFGALHNDGVSYVLDVLADKNADIFTYNMHDMRDMLYSLSKEYIMLTQSIDASSDFEQLYNQVSSENSASPNLDDELFILHYILDNSISDVDVISKTRERCICNSNRIGGEFPSAELIADYTSLSSYMLWSNELNSLSLLWPSESHHPLIPVNLSGAVGRDFECAARGIDISIMIYQNCWAAINLAGINNYWTIALSACAAYAIGSSLYCVYEQYVDAFFAYHTTSDLLENQRAKLFMQSVYHDDYDWFIHSSMVNHISLIQQ